MWLGRAPEGSSSGLHHDYHDNLYILLQGRKKFRLYDPSQVQHMYTYGRLRKVHRNGRIVYEGQGEVLEDGTDAMDVRVWKERVEAEQEVEKAEAQVKAGTKVGTHIAGERMLMSIYLSSFFLLLSSQTAFVLFHEYPPRHSSGPPWTVVHGLGHSFGVCNKMLLEMLLWILNIGCCGKTQGCRRQAGGSPGYGA